MQAIASLVLVLSIGAGCGVAAKPVSARGVRVEAPIPDDASQSAWIVCPRGGKTAPAGTTIVARHRGCLLVVGDGVEPELHRKGEMRLGPARHLRKVDAGRLLKALVRWDMIHVTVKYNRHPSVDAGCIVRGMPFDYDCPRASVPRLLANTRVVHVEVWNRFWVRWK